MALSKCNGIKEYWNAIGGHNRSNNEVEYFKRKDLLHFGILCSIPIAGQIALIIVGVKAYFKARKINKPILKQFDESHIKRLINLNPSFNIHQ